MGSVISTEVPIITFEQLKSTLQEAKGNCRTTQDINNYMYLLSAYPHETNLYRNVKLKYQEYM